MRAILATLLLLAAVSLPGTATANVTDVLGPGCGHHTPVDTMCPYEDCHNPLNCHTDTCIVWALEWCWVSF